MHLHARVAAFGALPAGDLLLRGLSDVPMFDELTKRATVVARVLHCSTMSVR